MRPNGRGSEGQSRRRHSAMRASRQDGSGHDKVRYWIYSGPLRPLALQLLVQNVWTYLSDRLRHLEDVVNQKRRGTAV
jgi:hypothetical protein